MSVLHIRVCQYAHICVYMYTCMSLCYSSPYVSLYEAWLDKQDISGISGMRIHFLKIVNESLNISSFQSLVKFTDKLPSINTCLIFSCQKVGKKLKQLLEILILIHSYYLPKVTSNFYPAVYSCEQFTRPKNYFASSPRILTVFKWNNHLWFYIACQLVLRTQLHVVMKLWKLQGGVMCLACIGKSLVKCLLYEVFSWSSEKKMISGSTCIWHKLFIQLLEILFPWQRNCLSKFL